MSDASHEADYRATVSSEETLGFLPGTKIELVRQRDFLPPEHAVFDFDGTLSLIREGWPEVMVPMMVEFLQETGTDETVDDLRTLAHGFVMELNGKQTIYQMIRLAEEIKERGGHPLEPVEYKNLYHTPTHGEDCGPARGIAQRPDFPRRHAGPPFARSVGNLAGT